MTPGSSSAFPPGSDLMTTWRRLVPISCLAMSALGLGLLAGAPAAGPARANPLGGTVVSGDATIVQQDPGHLAIHQRSDRAIINWQGFSIGAGELTQFLQPSAAAVALNRVTGGQVSQILGRLSANGQIYLINPNGIVFGAGAVVDVAGLIASTHDIRDRDFLAGRLNFDIPGAFDSRIVNRGLITAREGGLVALVAPSVENSGVIQVRLGRVVLAGANSATIDPYGDDLIVFEAGSEVVARLTDPDSNPLAALVENSGKISADGGRVLITVSMARDVVDGAINMTGYIQARSYETRNGEIVLDGGDTGTTLVTGTLDASGTGAGQTGGTVKVLGEQVALLGAARIDVSGDAGGGRALVGGAFQGRGPEPNALRTYIGGGAAIVADALGDGDGGEVIVWADGWTRYYGSISARGGTAGGDGGAVEVSGKRNLDFNGTIDVAAPQGRGGSILLDPTDIVIQAAGGTEDAQVADGEIFFTDGSGTFTLSETALEALTGNVTLEAENDITIQSGLSGGLSFSNQTAGEEVQFFAGRHVTIDSSVSTAGANLFFEADFQGAVSGADGIGTVFVAAGTSVSSSGGRLDLVGADVDIQGTVNAGSGEVRVGPNSNRTVGLGATSAQFSVSDAELDRITTSGLLAFGGPDAISVTVDGFTYAGPRINISAEAGAGTITFVGSTSTAADKFHLLSIGGISGGIAGGDIDVGSFDAKTPSMVLTGTVGGLTGEAAANAIKLLPDGAGPFTFNGFSIAFTFEGTTDAAVDQQAAQITAEPVTTIATADVGTVTDGDFVAIETVETGITAESSTSEQTVAVIEEIMVEGSLSEAIDYINGEGDVSLAEQQDFFQSLDGTDVVEGLLSSDDPTAQAIGQAFEEVLGGQDVSQAQMKAELEAMGVTGGRLLSYLGLFTRVRKQARTRMLRVAVEALTEESGGADVFLRAPAPRPGAAKAGGRKIALLIGVQDYLEPIPDLTTPLADVEAIGGLLRAKLGYETRILENPTRDEIVAGLQALVDELEEADSTIIMYAGHGYILEATGVGYWLAADARTDSADRWLSNTSISEALNAMRSKNIMLIADSCYSGTLLSGEHRVEGVRVRLNKEELRDRRSVVVMSSGGEEPVQDTGGAGHSVFAGQLMAVLETMETDGLGVEVYERVKARIAKLAPQVPQYGGVVSAGHELGADHLFELRL